MKSVAIALLSLAASARAAEPAISISVLPAQPLIEVARNEQRLNFDLLVRNDTAEAIDLSTVELTVLGKDGELVHQRRLGRNGDSIATLANRRLEPKGKIVVFNPFVGFEKELPLTRLRYELVFDTKETKEKYRREVTVTPRVFNQKTRLVLPVAGKTFIHDGHDALSHHRRLDVTGGMTTAIGITTNFTRYAYDFCVTDEKGSFYKGDGEKPEDWYGFGKPILAPGAGVVLDAVSDVADNTKSKKVPMDMEAVMKNIHRIGGNYVLIDHENGEFSFLCHMKKDTVTVKKGDRVKAGQKIGEMGMSGDAFLVHLHYQLQSGKYLEEGLPSYFDKVRLFRGTKWETLANGAQIDTGDIVESVK